MFGFHKKNEAAGPVSHMIVGLGNPGREYDGTRHNAGFLALDALAAQYGARMDRLKFKSLYGFAEIEGKRVLLLKPQTFMNLSGEAVCDSTLVNCVSAAKGPTADITASKTSSISAEPTCFPA